MEGTEVSDCTSCDELRAGIATQRDALRVADERIRELRDWNASLDAQGNGYQTLYLALGEQREQLLATIDGLKARVKYLEQEVVPRALRGEPVEVWPK